MSRHSNSRFTVGLLAGAALGLALAAASGAAAQGVGTYVNQYSGLSGNRNFVGYNFATDSQFNIFYQANSGGHTEYVACRADVPCATTRSGTEDVPPNAQGHALSSFNAATMSDTDQGGFSSGSGFARADLASGELGASSEGSFRSAFGIGSGIFTTSFATFGDSLTFTVADAAPGSVTDIAISLLLEGSMTRTTPDTGGSARTYLNFGGAVLDATVGYSNQTNTFGVIGAGANYWESYTFTPVGQGFLFTGIYGLRPGTTMIDVGEFLSVSCGNGSSCDYANTAALSFDLPSNVTFTSASGVFLTAGGPNGGVPEPASWALMILGFGAAGAALRRRRVAVA